jgi:hypothetical protein
MAKAPSTRCGTVTAAAVELSCCGEATATDRRQNGGPLRGQHAVADTGVVDLDFGCCVVPKPSVPGEPHESLSGLPDPIRAREGTTRADAHGLKDAVCRLEDRPDRRAEAGKVA